MADPAVRLDARLYKKGGGFDGAAYPIPVGSRLRGFASIALSFTPNSAESRFNPRAKSWAGARGLMQPCLALHACRADNAGITTIDISFSNRRSTLHSGNITSRC